MAKSYTSRAAALFLNHACWFCDLCHRKKQGDKLSLNESLKKLLSAYRKVINNSVQKSAAAAAT